MKTKTIDIHILLESILKIRLENCIGFLENSTKLYNDNLDEIDDELSFDTFVMLDNNKTK